MEVWMPGDRQSLKSWLNERQPSKYAHFYIGADIGKRRDPSTVAVIEAHWQGGEKTYLVRYLKRFSLSMLYTDMAAKLSRLDSQLVRWAATQDKQAIATYALDATGLGGPVCELVTQKMPYATIYKVYMTGGISTTFSNDDPYEIHYPKGQLLSGLMAAFDSGAILMSGQSKEIDQIVDELTSIRLHVTDEGRDHYGDRGKGHHSDLVMALSLAVALADMDGDSSGPIMW
jgi:hypothetical protein